MNHVLALDQHIMLKHQVLSSKKTRTAEFLKACCCLYDLFCFIISKEQWSEGTLSEIKVQYTHKSPSIPGSSCVLGSANTDLYDNVVKTWWRPLLISAIPYKKGNWYRPQPDNSFLPPQKLSQQLLPLPKAFR